MKVILFSFVFFTIEELEELTGNAVGKCFLAKRTTNALMATAYGLTNNGVEFILSILVK